MPCKTPVRSMMFRTARRLLLNRYSLAFLYLRGERDRDRGALHNPMRVSPRAKVRYVDRMTVADLRLQYPELQDKKLVPVDIVDDGERLATIPDGSQDFVIANHFLEHCQNPLLALENMFRVLRVDGVLYLALPDKRYTFDRLRPVTTLEHLRRDYEEGPEWSRREHFQEWVRLVNGVTDPVMMDRQVEQLLAMEYSIHYHVWTQREMLELLLYLAKQYPFDIEAMLRHKDEVIFIIRKAGDVSGLAPRIAAVVVLYHPGPEVIDNIRSWAGQVEMVYAVDNSEVPEPSVKTRLSALRNVTYLPQGENRGIARALNIGASRAFAAGYDCLLTMDQDSRAEADMVAKLLECRGAERRGPIGIVCPVSHDPGRAATSSGVRPAPR